MDQLEIMLTQPILARAELGKNKLHYQIPQWSIEKGRVKMIVLHFG